jgi:hypothetical protein
MLKPLSNILPSMKFWVSILKSFLLLFTHRRKLLLVANAPQLLLALVLAELVARVVRLLASAVLRLLVLVSAELVAHVISPLASARFLVNALELPVVAPRSLTAAPRSPVAALKVLAAIATVLWPQLDSLLSLPVCFSC